MMDKIKRSILAGLCIGLGGAIYLKLGDFLGAAMFSFGLLTIVHFKLPLYTGTAGFIDVKKGDDWKNMIIVLLGNIAGCYIVSLLNIKGIDATMVIQSKINAGFIQSLLNAIGCGFIMTIIVQAARDKNILLIFFGIPLFILLGFYHCVADAFYMSLVSADVFVAFIPTYLIIVIGNFIGCNVPRLLSYKKQ